MYKQSGTDAARSAAPFSNMPHPALAAAAAAAANSLPAHTRAQCQRTTCPPAAPTTTNMHEDTLDPHEDTLDPLLNYPAHPRRRPARTARHHAVRILP